MVTVVRLPGDNRAKELGEGLGEAFEFIVAKRLEDQKKKERDAALQEALTLFSAGMRGEKQQSVGYERSSVPQRALRNDTGQSRRPLPADRQQVETISPVIQERDITGKDVASILLGADIDEKFAFTLAAGLDEAKAARDKESKQSAAIGAALELAAQQGATREDLIASISTADVDPDTKLSLLGKLDQFLPPDEEEYDLELFTKEGESIKVPVDKSVVVNQASMEAWVKQNYPGYSARPIAKPTGEANKTHTIRLFNSQGGYRDIPAPLHVVQSQAATDKWVQENFPGYSAAPIVEEGEGTMKERGLQELLDKDLITPEMAAKHRAGVIRITQPDATGQFYIVDTSTNEVISRGGQGLTPENLRRIEARIGALTDAIYLLERTDPSYAGIMNALASEVGGIAIQVPVLRGIAQALGLTDDEISTIQAERGKFFDALMPIASSFAEGGGRSGLATRQQVEIAEKILNATRLASTPGGAELAKQNLIEIFTEIRARLTAQRLSRRIDVDITIPQWNLDDKGDIKGTIPGANGGATPPPFKKR